MAECNFQALYQRYCLDLVKAQDDLPRAAQVSRKASRASGNDFSLLAAQTIEELKTCTQPNASYVLLVYVVSAAAARALNDAHVPCGQPQLKR